MRVLRRQNEVDEAHAEEARADADADAAEARADAAATRTDEAEDRTTTGGRRSVFPTPWRRRDTDADTDADTGVEARRPPVAAPAVTAARADDTVEGDVVDHDRDRTERIETRPVTTESEIRTELWSWADAVVALIGAGLALVGLVVLARAGIDRTWYRPVVQIFDANHTAALGAAEVGAGALLMLAGVARSRAAAALVGLALAIMGALAALETSEVRRELAIEEWWAWLLAGVGLLVAVVALVPPRRSRVERVLETR